MAKYSIRLTPNAQRQYMGLSRAAKKAADDTMKAVAAKPTIGTYDKRGQSYTYGRTSGGISVSVHYTVHDREAVISVINIHAI